MSVPCLPTELIEYVVDFLHDNRTALASCALACRALLPTARFHLFRSLSVRAQNAPALEQLFNKEATLENHVRALKLMWSRDDEDMCQESYHFPPSIIASHRMPKLHRLVLSEVHHTSVRAILGILRTRPALRELEILYGIFDAPFEEVPEEESRYSSPASAHLQSLEIRLDSMSLAQALHARDLASTGTLDRLQKLSLELLWPKLRVWSPLLSVTRGCLLDLHLRVYIVCGLEGRENSLGELLQHGASLRTLRIEMVGTPITFPVFGPLADALAPPRPVLPHLERLHISVESTRHEILDHTNVLWERVGPLLQDRTRCPSLSVFHIACKECASGSTADVGKVVKDVQDLERTFAEGHIEFRLLSNPEV